MRLNYLACVLCLSAGCSGSAIVLDGGPEPDGSLPAGRLVLESAPSLTLVFGAESEIVVRYEESGAPASGVPLRFGLEGRANDSTLTELTVETDAQGRARASVIAGSVASVFRVRIDAERAASASVDVAVGDLGFGGLLVEAPYSGRREGAVRRVVEIGADLDCGSLRPGEGSRTMVFTSPSSAELVFPTLPVGPRYAVAARVEGSGGAVLARGCVDAIELVRDQQTRVSITIVDRPLTLAGDYDARVAVTSEPVIALVADVFTAAGETLVAAAGSPAALCLDALDRQLDPAGRAFLSTRRAALEASLAGDLDAAGEGPEVSLEIARSRLRERLSAITLAGPLGVGDTGATFAV
ncbi:MAG: hypothetical protein IT378_27575, partial [Sandaracinaceae bacterium]|nr:hypothetical protein [Sandaracinaceae bacterium]